MKTMTAKQQKLLLWISALLLIINLSALATLGYHLLKEQNKETAQNESETAGNFGGPAFNGRYFRDQLNLTEAQMEAFREVNLRFRSEASALQQELNQIRKNMLEELTAQNADSIRLGQLADALGKQHARLKIITFRYYLDINRFCTAPQKEQLKDIFKVFFDTETVKGNPGPGKYRNGQGWRRINQQ
ncbi:MAG: periplasmic heavy metal sensor [Marinilabiliales bacterium]|nr:periplasmic heavy metal sensor [Marinilabiliales bacterium]